jgi:hypothetical protein
MTVNEFPRGIFPDLVEKYIYENHNKQGFCIDFLYSSYLAVISALIGNRYKIKGIGWDERPLLWIAIVGSSGVKKTPAITSMMKPLEKYNKQLFDEYRKQLKEHKDLKSIGEKSDAPVAKQILVDDTTVEALCKIMEHNPDGLFLIKDELMGLIYDSQRYNKNGQEEKLLSIFSGKQIIINRKSDDSYSVIENPFLTLLGGIQPAILNQLFTENRLNNGFIYRLLFCYPDKIELKKPQDGFNIELYEEYENFLLRFTKLRSSFDLGESNPIVIELDHDAKTEFSNWLDSYIYKSNDQEKREHKAKMEAYVLRIGLIIEFSTTMALSHAPKSISINSISGAIKICEYFTKCYDRIIENFSSKTPNVHEEIKTKSIDHYKNGKKEAEIVNYLLDQGYRNVDISKALSISKSTVTFYSKNKV